MTIRAGICLVALVALLSAPCAAPPPSESNPAETTPRPEIQARIEQIVASIVAADRGGPDREISAMAEELQQRLDGDRESLLRQLVIYLANHRGNEQAMGGALLIASYRFTNEEKIAALAPRLDTGDDGMRDAMYEVLSTVDRPNGGPPDFGPYETFLRERETVPAGLVRYLYAVSPIDALAATARAYADGVAAETEAVRRARELEQVAAGREAGAGADPQRARQEIDALSRDPAWWVRLYAAHMLRAHPELGSPRIADRLRSDKHELVRAFAP